MSRNRKTRIGAVSYLNTRPLIHRLAEFARRSEVVLEVPSRLAYALASGELDVALIPSFELFRRPEYVVVSDACIGCRGPVLSVKLLTRKPLAEISTLALDEGSRTSAALVQILLWERFAIRPQLELLPLTAPLTECTADAVLLIGDRAIPRTSGPFEQVWDLGDEWCRWAELPFVFAVWAARADADLAAIDLALSQARDAGLAELPQVAAAHAVDLHPAPAAALSYLRDNLYFFLGPRECEGLRLFHERAAALELAPPEWELQFHSCREPLGEH